MSVAMNKSASGVSIFTLGITESSIDTYTGSTDFIKKMIGPSITSILNRRININPLYLNRHSIDGEEYFGYKETIPKDHCMFNLFCSNKQLKSLIEKQQVDEVNIYIIDKQSEIVQEIFVFKFKYTPEGNSKVPNGRVATKIAGSFFRSVNLVPNQNKFEEEAIIIKYGWQFNTTMPVTTIQKDFLRLEFEKPTNLQLLEISSCKTSFHKLILFTTQRQKLSTKKPMTMRPECDSLDFSNLDMQLDTQPNEFFTAQDDFEAIVCSERETRSKRASQTEKESGINKKSKASSTTTTTKANLKSPLDKKKKGPGRPPGKKQKKKSDLLAIIASSDTEYVSDISSEMMNEYYKDVDGYSVTSNFSKTPNTHSKTK